MDDSQVEESQQISDLEKNALSRKRRLQQFRSQLQTEKNKTEDEHDSEGGRMLVTFRSYKPLDIKVPEEIEAKKEEQGHRQMFLIEEKISDQLEDALDSTVKETVDVSTLAPRKIDWDLKRAIQDKMSVLERRTQKAIAQLIRVRLESGDASLASAVNSAARANEYYEDE